MLNASGESFAKIILIGEHAVVYGQPAIALPVKTIRLTATITPRTDGQQLITSTFYRGSLQAAATSAFAGIAHLLRALLTFFGARQQGFDLKITSALPPERGMGSSAATATAVVRAMYQAFATPLAHATLLRWTAISEKLLHGNPSGLDAATTSATRPQWFVRNQAPHAIAFPTNGSLVIADTGIPGQTKAAVAAVASRLQQAPATNQPRLAAIGQAVRQAALALAADDLVKLGAQLNTAQTQLAALGVSTPALDRLIQAARTAGALGAKLTGSGLGGCMIALATDHTAAETIAQALTQAGATAVWQYDFVQSEEQQ
ncbi:MAG: mevalonate kinase [Lactobacillus sp.]|jgi:mevalonate kinase|nr:mevalonate kinase [Lactobacillus sp.]MCI2033789.1 mevalonate kinase [Lactobacillus sp.]